MDQMHTTKSMKFYTPRKFLRVRYVCACICVCSCLCVHMCVLLTSGMMQCDMDPI